MQSSNQCENKGLSPIALVGALLAAPSMVIASCAAQINISPEGAASSAPTYPNHWNLNSGRLEKRIVQVCGSG
jgi:hypothetical protein